MAEKIARVATGSTAEMRDPKAKLSTRSSSYATLAWIGKKKEIVSPSYSLLLRV